MNACRALRTMILALTVLGGSAIAQPGPPPPPLPPVLSPPANPTTAAKAILGKALFHEEQLSSDNTVACATCHSPSRGGGDGRLGVHPGLDGLIGTPDDKLASPGVVRADANGDYTPDATFDLRVQVTRRAANSHIMAAYAPSLFWDGRATGSFVDPVSGAVVIPAGGALESQAVGPVLSDVEMAHAVRDWPQALAKLTVAKPLRLASSLTPDLVAALAANPTYPQLFQAAFGSPVLTAPRVAMAIAAYERTLVPNQTPWDAFQAGNPAALTPNQTQGLGVFRGPGRCAVCHTEPFFSNQTFRNIGLRPLVEDEGRFEVTGNPNDRGRFKVPSLRNVGLKASHMHNGQLPNLTAVVNFYRNPTPFAQNRDPVIGTINIAPFQVAQVVDFLQNALTDPRVAAGLPPFDRPTLGSEATPSPNPSVGVGVPGSGGRVPRMLAQVPANLGNADFKIGLSGALGSSQAYLALTSTVAPLGTSIGGVPVIIDPLDPALTIVSVITDGAAAAGEGYATFQIDVPDLPILLGLTIFGQWFVVDPGASAGVATSAAAAFTIRP